jgi:hypothetical protein
MCAATHGNPEAVAAAVANMPSAVDMRNVQGHTALMVTASTTKPEVNTFSSPTLVPLHL